MSYIDIPHAQMVAVILYACGLLSGLMVVITMAVDDADNTYMSPIERARTIAIGLVCTVFWPVTVLVISVLCLRSTVKS